jgi:hypothetical protein
MGRVFKKNNLAITAQRWTEEKEIFRFSALFGKRAFSYVFFIIRKKRKGDFPDDIRIKKHNITL